MAKNNEERQYDDAAAADQAAPAAQAAKPAKKYNLNNLNTLSVVSIATALSGFGAVAGVITGHVALSQLKTDGKQGRGLALAGMIVGYVGVGIALFSGIARVALGIWGARNGVDFGNHQGSFGNQGGMMGGWGDVDQNGQSGQNGFGHQGGMMGGFGQNDQNGQTGSGMQGWGNTGGVMPGQPNTSATTAPNGTNG
ncbi:MAG: hypothetical protein RL605_997 [Actinomycetota bacterium]|jgi:hypothetical protein